MVRDSVNSGKASGKKLFFSLTPEKDIATLLCCRYSITVSKSTRIDKSDTVDLFLNKSYHIILFGKGQKKRAVSLQENQIKLLVAYMQKTRLDDVANNKRLLFANNRGGKLTNSGLTYIIRQYANIAKVLKPELIPDKILPHTFRVSLIRCMCKNDGFTIMSNYSLMSLFLFKMLTVRPFNSMIPSSSISLRDRASD